MPTQGIHLCWIVVSNLDQAIQFYTQTLGLKLQEHQKEYGWAELSGPSGMRLGLAQENSHDAMKAGINAICAISVTDLEKTRSELIKNGVHLKGDVMEIPGQVKLQTFKDKDGNTFQLAQTL